MGDKREIERERERERDRMLRIPLPFGNRAQRMPFYDIARKEIWLKTTSDLSLWELILLIEGSKIAFESYVILWCIQCQDVDNVWHDNGRKLKTLIIRTRLVNTVKLMPQPPLTEMDQMKREISHLLAHNSTSHLRPSEWVSIWGLIHKISLQRRLTTSLL